LSFGLVNVPVTMQTAVRDVDLHFHQVHEKDAARIEVQRWCSEEGREVPFEEITRSYELDDGTSVTVSDEELAAVEPRRTRTIDIEQFVDLDEVDPILFDHPYFLAPSSDDDGALRAYRLLVETMSRSERAALGRFVMRAKEYMAIVRARDGVLTLATMRFADEVRDRDGIETGSGKSHKPAKKQLDAALAIIEELSADWDPDRYTDRYRERLEKVIARKRKGETIKAPAAATESAPAPDLMEALERTLAELSDGDRTRQRQEA
jgi:DNA end-binding protein Ku